MRKYTHLLLKCYCKVNITIIKVSFPRNCFINKGLLDISFKEKKLPNFEKDDKTD